MSEQNTGNEAAFEDMMLGDGGEVPMPSSAAESRGQQGTPLDQEVAEDKVAGEHRVHEGYVRPGESHSD